jgi:hypothetical protein
MDATNGLAVGRVKTIATVLFVGLWTLGCGGTGAIAPPPATPARAAKVDPVAAGLIEHHRHHHYGGVTLLIALSLDTIGVSPDQRPTVDKIRRAMLARMELARSAEQRLVTTLADGVAAGSFKPGKVAAAVAQVTASAAIVHDASTDLLNVLHDVLTPPERAALVDKVESHWTAWQKANAEEADPAHPESGRLAMLATELGLMQGQVDKIRVSLGERMKAVPRLDAQEIAEHLRAFADAFRGDKFDSRALTTGNSANAHLAGWGAAHLAHFIEAVSPVLTPDQRVEYAQLLREHAAHGSGGGS